MAQNQSQIPPKEQEPLPQKTLFMVAGCNGAGKSTVSRQMLPPELANTPMFDGDGPFTQKVKELQQTRKGVSLKEIKAEASGYVGKLFSDSYKSAISTGKPFAYEGHLTDKEQWMPLIDFKNAGYHTQMQYIGLKDVETSLARVGNRVKEGGHNVNPANVTHNFYINAGNVDKNHHLFDKLVIWDGESNKTALKQLVVLEGGKVVNAQSKEQTPKWVAELMPNISDKVLNFNRRESLVQEALKPEVKEAAKQQPGNTQKIEGEKGEQSQSQTPAGTQIGKGGQQTIPAQKQQESPAPKESRKKGRGI